MRARCPGCGHYHQDAPTCRAATTTPTGGAARCTCTPEPAPKETS